MSWTKVARYESHQEGCIAIEGHVVLDGATYWLYCEVLEREFCETFDEIYDGESVAGRIMAEGAAMQLILERRGLVRAVEFAEPPA